MYLNYPKSIEKAVEILVDALDQEDPNAIKEISEDDLIGVHMSLGQGIRNSMSLWGNK